MQFARLLSQLVASRLVLTHTHTHTHLASRLLLGAQAFGYIERGFARKLLKVVHRIIVDDPVLVTPPYVPAGAIPVAAEGVAVSAVGGLPSLLLTARTVLVPFPLRVAFFSVKVAQLSTSRPVHTSEGGNCSPQCRLSPSPPPPPSPLPPPLPPPPPHLLNPVKGLGPRYRRFVQPCVVRPALRVLLVVAQLAVEAPWASALRTRVTREHTERRGHRLLERVRIWHWTVRIFESCVWVGKRGVRVTPFSSRAAKCLDLLVFTYMEFLLSPPPAS